MERTHARQLFEPHAQCGGTGKLLDLGAVSGKATAQSDCPLTETAEWQAGFSLACFLPLALTMSWERGKCLTGPERAVKTIPEGVSPQANFLLPSQTEKLPGLALSIGTAPHIYLQAPRLSL